MSPARDANQMIQRLFHYAYCGGRLVDKHRPLNGAHRIASVFITSLLTCLYFISLKLVYAFFGFKVPEVVFLGMFAVVTAIGWGALKKWQFRQLHVSERMVNNAFSQRKVRACGWLSFVVSLSSIWAVFLTGVFTIANYKAWP